MNITVHNHQWGPVTNRQATVHLVANQTLGLPGPASHDHAAYSVFWLLALVYIVTEARR